MKLIDEEKVKISANEFEKENGEKIWFGTKEGSPGAALSVGSFKAGVSFAETELQNLAIEFAEWISNNYYLDDNGYLYNEGEYRTSSELFDEFIKVRSSHIEIIDPPCNPS